MKDGLRKVWYIYDRRMSATGIQMPIIFALYRVIYNIPAYVQSVRGYYETVISQLPAGYQTQDVFTQLAQACRMTGDKFDFTNVNTVIDLLYKFTAQQWQTLSVRSLQQVKLP